MHLLASNNIGFNSCWTKTQVGIKTLHLDLISLYKIINNLAYIDN
jgi:hypothetical protein